MISSKTAVILPAPQWSLGDLRRCFAMVEGRFGQKLSIFSPRQLASTYAQIFADRAVEDAASVSTTDLSDIVYFAEEGVVLPIHWGDGIRTYVVHPNGEIRHVVGQDKDARFADVVDVEDYPFLETHVFNAVSPRNGRGQIFYFPYGLLSRIPGLGPLDSLGFRISTDTAKLGERPSHHKLVAVFGGSTAFSIACRHEESFPVVLEQMLNAFASKQWGGAQCFTVLNFGQISAGMINEMVVYMLFCDMLRPDIVIAHDGFNDLVYGMINDPYLMQKFDLSYPYQQEEWARRMHGTTVPLAQDTGDLKPLNDPERVVDVYMRRKTQFREIVVARGGQFIWGLQPLWFGKGKLSSIEMRAILKHELERVPLRRIFEQIPAHYHLLRNRLNEQTDVVDMHAEMGRFGADRTLFADRVHLNRDGDHEVALAYFKCFRDGFMA